MVCFVVNPPKSAVYRHGRGVVKVFATPDTIAMAAMSHLRVVWMTVAARGVRFVVNPAWGVVVPTSNLKSHLRACLSVGDHQGGSM